MEKEKRKYIRKKNRVYYTKSYEERLVQGFFSVKGKHYKEAYEEVQKLVKKWKQFIK